MVTAKVDRTPVGAHYGLKGWLMQRVTAVIMVMFTLVLIGLLITTGEVNYTSWKSLFQNTAFRVLMLLFLLSLYLHAFVGTRDIIMDYIKPTGLKLVMQMSIIVFLVACTIWSVSILWS